MSYSKLNVLITGANRGLGFGFVEHLLKLDVGNVFAGFRSLDRAGKLQGISTRDSRLKMVRIDVASNSSIKEAADQVESYVGREGLNILINNGGVFNDKSLPTSPSREGMLEVFNINTIGPVMMTSMFLPLIQKAATLERPSKIINMSSIGGSIENLPEQQFWMLNASYSMSKAALNAYTKFFAFSDHSNIITVSLHPGWVRTHSDKAELSVEESVKSMIETIGRLKRKHSGSFIDHNGQLLPY